jgi:AbrB family looped-hinge helix DNA binding protein
MTIKKFSSSVQQKGQVTIPLAMREVFNIRPGDEIYFRSSPQGILITTEELERLAGFDETLDELSQFLAKREGDQQGSYAFDAVLEEIREKRSELLKEKYGIVASDE